MLLDYVTLDNANAGMVIEASNSTLLFDSIVADCDTALSVTAGSVLVASHLLLHSNTLDTSGYVAAESWLWAIPLFAAPENLDFQLLTGSLALYAGRAGDALGAYRSCSRSVPQWGRGRWSRFGCGH